MTIRSMTEVLEANFSPDAVLNTDELNVYKKAAAKFSRHEVVNHGLREYARGRATTNSVENSFSLLKRGLIGTFHHVGYDHLQRYVTEFDFRWNNRKVSDRERTENLLKSIGGKRLQYAQ